MSQEKRTTLRRETLAGRDTLRGSELAAWSSSITDRLLDIEEVRTAGTVFVYMHFRSEVRTMEFINRCLQAGKTVTIPHTLTEKKQLLAVRITDPRRDVVPGYCGIPEPAGQLLQTSLYNPKEIDVAIIPGSVFDRTCGRFGYGGGYYDRFLALEATTAFRIGLAFEMQITDRVPVQQHDQLMDLVVTEHNIYDCRR